jgi:hypothetical protein
MNCSVVGRVVRGICVVGVGLSMLCFAGSGRAAEARRLPVKVYRDKMKAGWIGQIAGVAWGAPTEFRYRDRIMPESAMPRWQPRMINDAFGQDDLYVEMTFLRSMEQYGLDVSIRQAGIDFANSKYPLWCANNAGRTNLRDGIAPPDSSHPKSNRWPNDIDYQINVCEKLARQCLARSGGTIEKDADAQEVFAIPVTAPKPSKLELSWAPGPIANSRFTAEEMLQITEGIEPALKRFTPGWTIKNCGSEIEPGLHDEWAGKKSVFVTHPLDRNTGCKLSRTIEVPAGKKVKLEVVNQPSGWAFEAAYWARIAVESK